MNIEPNEDRWSLIVSRIQRGSTFFGMFTNCILVQLILFKSPKQLGVYKYLMIYIASFELAYGFLDLLIVPDMFTQDSAFFVMVDPRKSLLPESCIQLADLIFCGAYGVSLAIFSVQFAYRYFVLTGKTFLTTKKHTNFLIWMGSPLVFASIWSASCAVFMTRNSYVDRVLREDALPNMGNLDIDRLAILAVIFLPKLENSTIETTVNWDSFYISICCCVLASTEFIMSFFAIKSYFATKKFIAQAGGSSQFKRLQWQLFYAIVLQSCIPIFFMQLPVSATYISMLLNSSTQLYGQILAITVSFYLATDALPTILIIKVYRDTVLDFFRFFLVPPFCKWSKGGVNKRSVVGSLNYRNTIS